MSARAAASAAVTGLSAAFAGAGAVEVDDGDAPSAVGVPAPSVAGGAGFSVEHEGGRDGGALGYGSGHHGGCQRGKEHLALPDHGCGMLGAFSLAGDGAEEGVGPQAGRLNGNAQGSGCGLQLGLAD